MRRKAILLAAAALLAGAVVLVVVSRGGRDGEKTSERAEEPSAPVKPDPAATGVAAERAKALKAHLDTFVLVLQYHGGSHKPFYNLTLAVPEESHRSRDFWPAVYITKAQAVRIVDHLAKDGFLARAGNIANKEIMAPKGPCYTLTVAGPRGLQLYEVLGWDLAMLKRLDALAEVLEGEAKEKMSLLLGRLSGYRREWEAQRAMTRAAVFAKERDLGWGKPLRARRTASKWHRVEFAKSDQGQERVVLVNPENGHAELPMRR
jgi:hypothetical protein